VVKQHRSKQIKQTSEPYVLYKITALHVYGT